VDTRTGGAEEPTTPHELTAKQAGGLERASKDKNVVMKWTKGIVLGLLSLILLAAVTGLSYQAIATQIDKRNYPAPGQMVDVGGQLLHVHSMGKDQEGPTVILEGGLGGGVIQWPWVQPEVAEFAPVVSYDRAGLGWSEGGEYTDARSAAQQLHTALDEAEIEGPSVLVGHSFGGTLNCMYAQMYPEEVVGMVLLDSSHPEQTDRLAEAAEQTRSSMDPMRLVPDPMQLVPLLGRFGIIRATGILNSQVEDLPPQQRVEGKALLSSTAHLSGMAAEFANMEATFSQVRQETGDLGDMPLVVLSAAEGAMDGWMDMQVELAALSSEGVHRVSEQADHEGLVMNQEHSRATVEAIEEVVEVARAETKGDGPDPSRSR
jgi:pimeloyl-ACP methyl ester carboxylesterase